MVDVEYVMFIVMIFYSCKCRLSGFSVLTLATKIL